MPRLILTRPEWEGFMELNRRLLELWVPGQGWDAAAALVRRERLRVAAEVAAEGFELPPRICEELIAGELRPNLFTERLREVA